MKRNTDSLMLLEMALAILFFALSAAVILQVFAGTHQKSLQSDRVTMATFIAEDAINAFKASGEDAAAHFTAEGYTQDETGFKKRITVNGSDYDIAVTNTLSQGNKGAFIQGRVEVDFDAETPISLPFARFLQKEVP